jgi:hypothetical protein
MTENVAVPSQELLKALDRGAGSGFESGKALADPEMEAFRAQLQEARALLAAHPDKDNVFGSLDDRMVSLMQSFLARNGEDLGGTAQPSGNGFEAKFDSLDPGWVWSLRDWIKKLDTHPFLEAAGTPDTIANDYRIALLSDWGTGAYGAPVCARSIAEDSQHLDLLMHLGDVYYAGDIDEIQQRFLAHWPQRAGALHRALNGNHEMYSGGKGYFAHILAKFEQPASYFALRNDHWLLVGLDTAYASHSLFGDQAQWLNTLAAAHPAHRIMLFTHHQPFSYFESGGLELVRQLSGLLRQGRIPVWYWGHEHSCTIYQRHPQWQMHGRCIGHSGFPYFRRFKDMVTSQTRWVPFPGRDYIPAGQQLDGPNPYVHHGAQLYGPNGYVTVELQGPKVHETYRDPAGSILLEIDL